MSTNAQDVIHLTASADLPICPHPSLAHHQCYYRGPRIYMMAFTVISCSIRRYVVSLILPHAKFWRTTVLDLFPFRNRRYLFNGVLRCFRQPRTVLSASCPRVRAKMPARRSASMNGLIINFGTLDWYDWTTYLISIMLTTQHASG